MKYDLYFAAPLFTQAEREFNLKAAAVLKGMGYSVFLPQEECAKTTDLEKIYSICVKGVLNSKAVVAVLDGADADSGTCWEVGYATALAKPIIGYRTDFRQCGDAGGLNLMLKYSCWRLIEDIHRMPRLSDLT